ncbi:unnamed protein product [Vicia faba]|uniref:Uncharacterized protein n=1 Tax=Vicia faba TaxID=3906 RepID=A0AAV0YHC6_VICFA|nr:unnamed protein product [Vicia faba]
MCRLVKYARGINTKHSHLEGYYNLYQFPQKFRVAYLWISFEGYPKVQGVDTVMVIVDRLTKYAHFLPVSIHIQQKALLTYSLKRWLGYMDFPAPLCLIETRFS